MAAVVMAARRHSRGEGEIPVGLHTPRGSAEGVLARVRGGRSNGTTTPVDRSGIGSRRSTRRSANDLAEGVTDDLSDGDIAELGDDLSFGRITEPNSDVETDDPGPEEVEAAPSAADVMRARVVEMMRASRAARQFERDTPPVRRRSSLSDAAIAATRRIQRTAKIAHERMRIDQTLWTWNGPGERASAGGRERAGSMHDIEHSGSRRRAARSAAMRRRNSVELAAEGLRAAGRGARTASGRALAAWAKLPPAPYQQAARLAYATPEAQVTVALLIFGNFIASALEAQLRPQPGTALFEAFWRTELAFNIAFTTELALNAYAHWFRAFWRSPWVRARAHPRAPRAAPRAAAQRAAPRGAARAHAHSPTGRDDTPAVAAARRHAMQNVFDVIIVTISWVAQKASGLPGVGVLRLFRAFRVFRLFKRVQSLRVCAAQRRAARPQRRAARAPRRRAARARAGRLEPAASLSRARAGPVAARGVGAARAHPDPMHCARLDAAPPARHSQVIIEGALASMPGVANTFVVLGLLMAIFAVIAVDFFGGMAPQLFGNFAKSMFTLWQAMTGDNWSGMARQVSAAAEDARHEAEIYGDTASAAHSVPDYAPKLFFVAYTFISTIVMSNVVIAVLLDKYLEATARAASALERERAEGTPAGARSGRPTLRMRAYVLLRILRIGRTQVATENVAAAHVQEKARDWLARQRRKRERPERLARALLVDAIARTLADVLYEPRLESMAADLRLGLLATIVANPEAYSIMRKKGLYAPHSTFRAARLGEDAAFVHQVLAQVADDGGVAESELETGAPPKPAPDAAALGTRTDGGNAPASAAGANARISHK